MSNRRTVLALTAVLATAALLSGCGLLSAIPRVGTPPAVPAGPGGAPGAGSGGGAIGGGTGGDPGTGNGGGAGGGGGIVQPPGEPVIVVVHPGQASLRIVHAVELRFHIDANGHVIVRVRWWGGIEPCDTLDSVDVGRDGTRFTITARVGSPPGAPVVCIDIARDTATLVDLGVLPSGTYTVTAADGDAAPLTVMVP